MMLSMTARLTVKNIDDYKLEPFCYPPGAKMDGHSQTYSGLTSFSHSTRHTDRADGHTPGNNSSSAIEHCMNSAMEG